MSDIRRKGYAIPPADHLRMFSAEELIQEEWRLVQTTQRVEYEVSSLGRIRARWFRMASRPWRLLILRAAAGTGYLTTRFGRRGNLAVHSLVLTTFIGARPPGTEAAHLNGNRIDARLCNLRWVSAIENQAHKKLHGTQPRGGLHYAAKLNETQVKEIRSLLSTGQRVTDLAARFGVTVPTLCNIKSRKSWAHVA